MLAVLLFALTIYVAVAAVFYFSQRRLLFPANTERVQPAEAGLVGFEEVVLRTGDGQRVIGWWSPPAPGAGAVLYFHGNGGSLAQGRDRFETMQGAGLGVLAMAYRGYGGSSGQPSETALISDAKTALDWLGQRAPEERTAVMGQSLGSGVAVALAAERQVGGLVLDSPYASIECTAARLYPWLPVRLLARDRFDSETRVRRVREPILIAHCTEDRLIPVAEARRLYARATGPKSLQLINGCGHIETWDNATARATMLGALTAFTRGEPWPPASSEG